MIHVVLASPRFLINEECSALGPRGLIRKHYILAIRRLIYQTYDGRQILTSKVDPRTERVKM